MKQVFLSTTTEFKEIETLEPGSWINLVNPSQSESMEIASALILILQTCGPHSMRKKCPV